MAYLHDADIIELQAKEFLLDQQHDFYRFKNAPEEDYGIVHCFLVAFITDNFRSDFPEIARKFLKEESQLSNPETRKKLQRMYYPVCRERSISDPYIMTILEMILICARDGSEYSKELLLELYKNYHREEYKVFRRYKILRERDLEIFYEIECERYGTTMDEVRDLKKETGRKSIYDMRVEIPDLVIGRLVVMSQFLGVELELTFNCIIDDINKWIYGINTNFRMLSLMPNSLATKETSGKAFKQNAEWVSNNFSLTAWEIYQAKPSKQAGAKQQLYYASKIIFDTWDKENISRGMFLQDPSLNLYTCAVNVLEDLSKFATADELKDDLALYATIKYFAEMIVSLEHEREQEMAACLDIDFDYLVKEEDLLRYEIVTKQDIENYRKAHKHELDKDLELLLKKIQRSLPDALEKESPVVLATEDPVEKAPEDATEALKDQLKAKDAKIRELEGKLDDQRRLLKKSREIEASYKVQAEQWRLDSEEVVVLRDFVHSLESENIAPASVSLDEMTRYLKKKKLIIVGGQQGWVQRMKETFPDWNYLTAGESLSVVGSVQSCDKVYFFTDFISHPLRNRFQKIADTYEKPYGYVRGTNMENVITYLYQDMKKTDK